MHHLSGHSGRAVAGRAARARLTGSPGEPPRDDGRSAPRWTLRPDVGRDPHANGARADERAGVRQEECGGIHRAGKRGDLCEHTGGKSTADLKYTKSKGPSLTIKGAFPKLKVWNGS